MLKALQQLGAQHHFFEHDGKSVVLTISPEGFALTERGGNKTHTGLSHDEIEALAGKNLEELTHAEIASILDRRSNFGTEIDWKTKL